MGSILYYEESGSGFPLILLHGNGESCEYFVHQVAHYEKFFHVIALDTRGQGKSPRGMTEYTINQFAEDVHEFMEEHQIAKAHVLGFSDGGNIAVTFALKYPQMVEKLILDGANIFPEGVEQDFLDRVEFAYARECRKAEGRAGRGEPGEGKSLCGAAAAHDPGATDPAGGACRAHHAGAGHCRNRGHHSGAITRSSSRTACRMGSWCGSRGIISSPGTTRMISMRR